MLAMWKSRTHDQRLQDPASTDKGDHNGRTERGGVKRRKSPVRDGLRDGKLKPIRMTNLYAALNHTESLDKESDHMIKVNIHSKDQEITTNVMIDLGATDNFIDRDFCITNQLPLEKMKKPRGIFVVDGKSSSAGPITYTTTVPMDIGTHREIVTFQVANLKKHEAILGMPWLRKHSPRIDWTNDTITFDSDRCTSTCLDALPKVDAVPEEQAIKENLRTRLMNTETTYPVQKEGKPVPQPGRKVQWDLRSTSAPRAIRHSEPEEVQVTRLTERAKIPN